MDISIIIPNYNGEEILSKNLPKVLEEIKGYKKGDIEVIITDDFSTDKSVEVIKKFPQIKLITSLKNTGFSSNVNRGVAKAKGDIILLLNTDVYPEKGFLDPLINHFKDENVFAVGCMDKSVEGTDVILRGRGVAYWRRGFFVHQRGEVDKNDTMWVSGGSGAFRKLFWDKLGGLNSLYDPFYWEDIDLSYRAQKAGYKVLFEPKSVVWHEHEKGAIKRKYTPFTVKTIAFRNQFFFVWTNVTDLNLLISHFLWLPYHFLNTILKGDFAFLLGFFRSLILTPKVIQSRNRNKKFFVIKDKQLLKK